MHKRKNVHSSDKSNSNKNGVIAIDESINSLVNFLDSLLKSVHYTLDQLELYYQTHMSAVLQGMQLMPSEQKKIDSKYNQIKNHLEEFLKCIVEDYAEFIQDAYEIRTLHQKYEFYINYLQKLSTDNKPINELNNLIPQVEKLKKQIDKLVLQYNSEITKLSYLKLNLKYRVIVYKSSFTGNSFSIPINVLIRNFKNLIQSNGLVVVANQIDTSLLEKSLSNIQTLSERPELIYARSINLDPSLTNITESVNQQSSSAQFPQPESLLRESSRRKRSGRKFIEQESLQQKLPRQERKPPQVETPVSEATTPIAATESLETAQPRKESNTSASSTSMNSPSTTVRKRPLDLTPSEGEEAQNLGENESDESNVKQKRQDSNDETESIDMDETNAENVSEDHSSIPSLEDELFEAERRNALSSSSSPVEPKQEEGTYEKPQERLEQKQKQSTQKIFTKVKPHSKTKSEPKQPIQELKTIEEQEIITKEFYEEQYKELTDKINKIEELENETIIEVMDNLCEKYRNIREQLNSDRSKLKKTEREMEQLNLSEDKSKNVLEDLEMKKEKVDEFQTRIVDNELEIRRIKSEVHEIGIKDYHLQIFGQGLYDIQRYLCERWLEQLKKNLETDPDDTKSKQLREDIRKVTMKLEQIASQARDWYVSYKLRKKRRMTSGPHEADFCMKRTISWEKLARKYGGKEYKPGQLDPLEKEEPVRKTVQPSTTINILTPKRKPQ